jgi:hypothetical protein
LQVNDVIITVSGATINQNTLGVLVDRINSPVRTISLLVLRNGSAVSLVLRAQITPTPIPTRIRTATPAPGGAIVPARITLGVNFETLTEQTAQARRLPVTLLILRGNEQIEVQVTLAVLRGVAMLPNTQ